MKSVISFFLVSPPKFFKPNSFMKRIKLQLILTALTTFVGFANRVQNSDFTPNANNYCIPKFSNNLDYIKDVTTTGGFTNLNNTNTGAGTNGSGYSDYTSKQLVMVKGTNVSFNVNLEGKDYLSIWIDKNNDGIFNEPDEKVFNSLIDDTSHSGSLNTNTLTEGTYRLRLIAHYSISEVTPCSDASFGEAEDYTIVVHGTQPCLPVTALNKSDATLTSIKISWTAGGTETSWNVEYGVKGFTKGTGTNIVVNNPFVVITDLTAKTYYDVYVQADYGNDNKSTWTGPFPLYLDYCKPQGLTTSNKYYTSKFYTTGAATNLNYSATSGVGYVDQTSLPFSVKAGIPFKWSISASTGENFYFYIWVDWDNNGVFDEPAIYKSPTGYEVAPKNISYTVNQPVGTYRMRVTTAYMGGYSVGPCGTNTHGNYVDFNLVVTCPTTTPIGETIQNFTAGQTIADLDVDGDDLVWYSDENLTTNLPTTTKLVHNATYYVRSENGNCKSSVLAIKVEKEANRSNFDVFGFSYYPNPVNDILYFSSNQPIENVIVSNMLGQQINVSVSSDNKNLDLSNLQSGNYFVKVTIEGVSKAIKVVKR